MQRQNDALPFLESFMAHKMLSKLGYRFDLEELEVFEYEAFQIIDSTINEMQQKQMKQNKPAMPRKR